MSSVTEPPVPDPAPTCWPIDYTCMGEDWAACTAMIRARAEQLAVQTLRRLTGGRVGGCPITVRPCKRGCLDGSLVPSYYFMQATFGPGWFPSITANGTWINSCGCTTDCACEALCEIALPPPVGGIVKVKIDGITLDETDYRLDGNRLVWTGEGDCPWPACQNMAADDDAEGTFSVTYYNSYRADAVAAFAAGLLAYEYSRACTGLKCRLPMGVSTIARNGVTIDLPTGAFPGGVTGIREVDAFVALWRPEGAPDHEATVWSPDLRSPRVVPTAAPPGP